MNLHRNHKLYFAIDLARLSILTATKPLNNAPPARRTAQFFVEVEVSVVGKCGNPLSKVWSNKCNGQGVLMKSQKLMLASIALAALWTTGSEAAQPAYVYTTTVQLAEGKTLSCAVNEPADALHVSRQPLTRREQAEAGVLATQRLRLLSGPTSDYPTPYTAPNVICGGAG
jgi:hypothetical protein